MDFKRSLQLFPVFSEFYSHSLMRVTEGKGISYRAVNKFLVTGCLELHTHNKLGVLLVNYTKRGQVHPGPIMSYRRGGFYVPSNPVWVQADTTPTKIKQGSNMTLIRYPLQRDSTHLFNNALLNVKAFLAGFPILSLPFTKREVGMMLRYAKKAYFNSTTTTKN